MTADQRRRLLMAALLVALVVTPVRPTLAAGGYSGLSDAAAATNPTASVGFFSSETGEWHLRENDGSTNSFYFGVPGDIPLMGDWDCDGIDTVGIIRRPELGSTEKTTAFLRNSNDLGSADLEFFFPHFLGWASYPVLGAPLVGDWNGDGCDTLGDFLSGRIWLHNSLPTTYPGLRFFFGGRDIPLTGDFDSDGLTEIGVYRESTGKIYLRDDHTTGFADHEFFYGLPDDQLVVGDWNHDGIDTVGVWRPTSQSFYLADTNDTVFADHVLPYASGGGWLPVAGNFS